MNGSRTESSFIHYFSFLLLRSVDKQTVNHVPLLFSFTQDLFVRIPCSVPKLFSTPFQEIFVIVNFKLFFNEYFSFSWVGEGDKSFF